MAQYMTKHALTLAKELNQKGDAVSDSIDAVSPFAYGRET